MLVFLLFFVNFRDAAAAAKVSAQQCLSNYLNLFYTSRRVVLPALSRSLPLSACQLSNESANAVAVDCDADIDSDSDVAFL